MMDIFMNQVNVISVAQVVSVVSSKITAKDAIVVIS